MSKACCLVKNMGIGDLCILIPYIQAISKKINKPVTVLAQKLHPRFEREELRMNETAKTALNTIAPRVLSVCCYFCFPPHT